MKHSLRLVKYYNKKAVFLLFLFSLIVLAQFSFTQVKNNTQISAFYLKQLKTFTIELKKLQQLAVDKATGPSLKKSFHQARLTYKKLSIFTEYYNIYESKLLNGAALPWVQDDNPAVIDPHGLQVVEAALFGVTDIDHSLILDEVKDMIKICNTLEQEADLDFKFNDQLVMEALQLSLVRVMTMGIAGFDSPVALYSLPESASTIQGLITILNIYKDKLRRKSPQNFEQLIKLLNGAHGYLRTHNDFNSFDRLTFINSYISPAYSFFTKAATSNGLLVSGPRRPLNANALSFFMPDAFNVKAFSPTNRYGVTKERIELGRKLFYDPILSLVKDRTCASCHKPELAFTDGNKTAISVDGKTALSRNTPTLWNSVFQTKQFFDSRTTVLENQLSDVVHNQEEMKGSLKESVTVLKEHPEYAAMFAKAYANENEQIHPYTIANAISSYIRSLVALNSRFDKYMRGNSGALNAREKNGFNLFMGKAKCATCHFMPLFNGLVPPAFTETESEVLGVPVTKDTLNAILDKDKGKFNYTGSPAHLFAFKTPTLRNIALTAPYMHNGVFSTLEEVMDFYNKGGGTGLKIAPPNQTLPPEKLNLTKKEISDVIAFMRALTDTVGGH